MMKLHFDSRQRALLQQMEYEVSDGKEYDEEDLIELDALLMDFLDAEGMDEDDKPNETGLLCQQMMDLIGSASEEME